MTIIDRDADSAIVNKNQKRSAIRMKAIRKTFKLFKPTTIVESLLVLIKNRVEKQADNGDCMIIHIKHQYGLQILFPTQEALVGAFEIDEILNLLENVCILSSVYGNVASMQDTSLTASADAVKRSKKLVKMLIDRNLEQQVYEDMLMYLHGCVTNDIMPPKKYKPSVKMKQAVKFRLLLKKAKLPNEIRSA